MTKSKSRRKGLFGSCFYQGRDLETGADAEAREECSMLASLSLPAQPAFLWNLGPPAQGWYYLQRSEPSPINH